MKFLAALLMIVYVTTGTITNDKRKIKATVTNVSSDKGKVGFALYNKTTFMKKPIQAKNAKIENGVASVTFEDLEPGEYSIVCFHDQNDNDVMDFQENGMPLEDYGASNNVMSFGPPKFSDSKFTVSDKDIELDIKF